MKRKNAREHILAAARTAFARKGYDGASIRDIAQEAELSLSALYYYFKSKEDALFALIQAAFEQFIRGARKVLAGSGEDPRRQLADLVQYTVRYRVVNAETSRVLIQETGRLNADKHKAVRAKQVESNDLFHDVVDRGVELGLFQTPYPDDAARAIVAMCNAISTWYHPGGEISLDQLVERYEYFAFQVVGHEGALPKLPPADDSLIAGP